MKTYLAWASAHGAVYKSIEDFVQENGRGPNEREYKAAVEFVLKYESDARITALERQLAHLRKEKITTLLLSGFSQFQVDLIMAGYDSELTQAEEVGNE